MDARTVETPTPTEMNDLLLRLMRGVNAQAFDLFGRRVLTGPFSGMVLANPGQAPWDDGNWSTKLLGCYEFELHDAIRYAAWRRPGVIVNVGCAEGYYAVGMARLLREAQVYAYDTNLESLEICKELSNENGVWIECLEGVRASGALPGFVLPPANTLYIFDCEGAEEGLIDLEMAPYLAQSDVIVECHDFLKPGLSSRIADRLAATHRVELIRPKLPDLAQFAFARDFPGVMTTLMITEKRPMPCCWLACWANRRGSNG